MARSPSRAALGLGLLAWLLILFAPLAFVQTARAEDVENYGTVIGIVSTPPLALVSTG
jgi:endoplasmic reticulum chaperone BiP